jgi:hypothetical protein
MGADCRVNSIAVEGGCEDVYPGAVALPVAVAREPTEVLAGDGSGVGAVDTGEMLLQVVAFLLIDGFCAAKPQLASTSGGGMHAECLMANREVQGVGLNEIVEEHHGPIRAARGAGIDVRPSRVEGSCPRQEAGEVRERNRALP